MFGSEGVVNCVAISHDNRTVVAGYEDGHVDLSCLETGSTLMAFPRMFETPDYESQRTQCMVVSQGGGSLAYSLNNRIENWTWSPCTQTRTFMGVVDDVLSVVYTSHTSPTQMGSVCSRCTHTCTLFGEDDVLSVVYTSPTQMVTGSSDGMRVWDTNSGECTQVLSDHNGPVRGLSVSADGSVLVSASEDNTLKQLGLRRGGSEWECTLTLTGHTSAVLCVAVSPGGDLAVSGSRDDSIRVWDLKTGTCKQVLQGHNHLVTAIVLSGDSKIAISGGDDNKVKIWQLFE